MSKIDALVSDVEFSDESDNEKNQWWNLILVFLKYFWVFKKK